MLIAQRLVKRSIGKISEKPLEMRMSETLSSATIMRSMIVHEKDVRTLEQKQKPSKF